MRDVENRTGLAPAYDGVATRRVTIPPPIHVVQRVGVEPTWYRLRVCCTAAMPPLRMVLDPGIEPDFPG